MRARSVGVRRWGGIVAAVLAAAQPARGEARTAGDARDRVLGAGLVRNGQAVSIRTARGSRVFGPGRGDTAFAGYEAPVVAPDRRAVAWVEETGMPRSDASHPEPFGVWLFSRGRLIRTVGCDSGQPWKIRFDDGGTVLVVSCSFPHGPPRTRERSFDAADGRHLGDRRIPDPEPEPEPDDA